MSRLLCVTLLAVSLASATPLSTYPSTDRRVAGVTLAPLVAHEHPHGSVNNSYIVMLKDGIAPALMANHMNFLQNAHASDPEADAFVGLTHVYDGHVKGYAGKFSASTLDQIRMMPEVEYVEHDQIVRTLEVERYNEFEVEKHATQKGAPWVSSSHTISPLQVHHVSPHCGIRSLVYPCYLAVLWVSVILLRMTRSRRRTLVREQTRPVS